MILVRFSETYLNKIFTFLLKNYSCSLCFELIFAHVLLYVSEIDNKKERQVLIPGRINSKLIKLKGSGIILWVWHLDSRQFQGIVWFLILMKFTEAKPSQRTKNLRIVLPPCHTGTHSPLKSIFILFVFLFPLI